MLETLRWSVKAPTRISSGHGHLPVADDVMGLRLVMVNVYFIDNARRRDSEATDGWVLVDAGLPGSAASIKKAAEERYGPGARPEAILLTHAHFDHVGSLKALAEMWDVPVYAHTYELPYLTGQASYAPPDPWVGGAMSLTSPLYPRGPIDLGDRVRTLPKDHRVPHLPGWRWVSTQGHSPGHVSFFRESDRLLIAGDAFVTTRQESMLAVLTQAQHVCGPPSYFTHDWQSAEQSVRKLAELNPSIAATGHGTPMWGRRLTQQLNQLVEKFREKAVPKHGRYAHRPVVSDERGPQLIPPRKAAPTAIAVAAIALAGVGIALALRRDEPA